MKPIVKYIRLIGVDQLMNCSIVVFLLNLHYVVSKTIKNHVSNNNMAKNFHVFMMTKLCAYAIDTIILIVLILNQLRDDVHRINAMNEVLVYKMISGVQEVQCAYVNHVAMDQLVNLQDPVILFRSMQLSVHTFV